MRIRLFQTRNVAAMIATSLGLLLAPSASAEFDVVYELTEATVRSPRWGVLGTLSSPGSATIRFSGTTGNVIHGPIELVESLIMTFTNLTGSSLGDFFVGAMAIRFIPYFHGSNSQTLRATGTLASNGDLSLIGLAFGDLSWHCSGASCGGFDWYEGPMTSSVTQTEPERGALFGVFFEGAATPGSNTLQTSFTGFSHYIPFRAPVPPFYTPKSYHFQLVEGIRMKEVSRTNVVEDVVQTPSLSGAFVALLMGLLCASAVFWLRRNEAAQETV